MAAKETVEGNFNLQALEQGSCFINKEGRLFIYGGGPQAVNIGQT